MTNKKQGYTYLKGIKVLLFFFFISVAIPAAGQVKNSKAPVEKKADLLATFFQEKPFSDISGNLDQIFTGRILMALPKTKLKSIFTHFYKKYGEVIRIETNKIKSPTLGSFYLIFEKGYKLPVTSLAVTSEPPHHIAGFYFGAPEPLKQPKSFEELIQKFQSLPGKTSLFVAKIGKNGRLKQVATYQPQKTLAIGSSFKLYVLGALVEAIEEGQRSWRDITELNKADKSLPSGILQTWPAGSPLTLHTVATLMISMSDNTAADLLIETLDRQTVEKALALMGHHEPALNRPFLKTQELFTLKADSSLAQLYISSSVPERRQLLQNKVELKNRAAYTVWSHPKYINSLEWFASTKDMAQAIAWFKRDTKAAQVAREILTVNHGLNLNKSKWAYVGYKGGSEPGVLNMTYLLQSTDGKWYVLSAGWNNEKENLDMTHFFSLVKQSISLIP